MNCLAVRGHLGEDLGKIRGGEPAGVENPMRALGTR